MRFCHRHKFGLSNGVDPEMGVDRPRRASCIHDVMEDLTDLSQRGTGHSYKGMVVPMDSITALVQPLTRSERSRPTS